jgi:hypothetical protein
MKRYTHEQILRGDVPTISLINEGPNEAGESPTDRAIRLWWRRFERLSDDDEKVGKS